MTAIIPAPMYSLPCAAWIPTLVIWYADGRFTRLEAVDLDGQLAEWSPEARALVFPNTRGHIGRHSTFMEHVWQPLLKAAKLKYRKPHSMRHTFATWALEGNDEKGIAPAPILAVRDSMGHASVQETDGYLHRSTASTRRAWPTSTPTSPRNHPRRAADHAGPGTPSPAGAVSGPPSAALRTMGGQEFTPTRPIHAHVTPTNPLRAASSSGF